jgi:hypothetical protein
LCLNLKLATQFENFLLPPFSNAIVINHIIPCLPRTPSMLWCLCQMNKMLFTIVSKSLSWNTLEMVKLDYIYYFNYIWEHGMKRQPLEARFEIELFCATECLATINIYLDCDSNIDLKDLKLGLQTP